MKNSHIFGILILIFFLGLVPSVWALESKPSLPNPKSIGMLLEPGGRFELGVHSDPDKPLEIGIRESGELVMIPYTTVFWNDIPGGADYYEVEWMVQEPHDGYYHTMLFAHNIYRTSYPLQGNMLFHGLNYSWHVRAYKDGEYSDFSDTMYFNIISDTPSCPINSQRPTINWPDNGWFYPLRSPEGNELVKKETMLNQDFDEINPLGIAPNQRHLGVDLMCNGRTGNCPELKYSVYAIGDGTVVDVSHHSGWGGDDPTKPNLIVIKHRAADGTIFYALYGHLKNIPPNLLKTVRKGQFIGNTLKVNEEHLHFSLDNGSISAGNQRYHGYTASKDKHAGDYGFYDPVLFLKSHQPESEESSLGSIENTANTISTEPVLKPALDIIQDALLNILTWFNQFIHFGS